jgi:hypothetical protein
VEYRVELPSSFSDEEEEAVPRPTPEPEEVVLLHVLARLMRTAVCEELHL